MGRRRQIPVLAAPTAANGGGEVAVDDQLLADADGEHHASHRQETDRDRLRRFGISDQLPEAAETEPE